MRLIDADALFLTISQNDYLLATRNNSTDYGMFTLGIKQAIDEQKTVDAVPVKHGHWEIAIGYDPAREFLCSECYKMAYEPSRYCPACGAEMNEVSE